MFLTWIDAYLDRVLYYMQLNLPCAISVPFIEGYNEHLVSGYSEIEKKGLIWKSLFEA